MKIKQFEDSALSHYSYAILSETESRMILIDPSRNIRPYQDFAKENNATIIGIIETHPHADFVSAHLELHQLYQAPIYCSTFTQALYPHIPFDDQDVIELGELRLKSLHTPGHSPDSISVLLSENGINKAIFTGDTLFIGDCGRPDLRENSSDMRTARELLSRQMYHTLRNIYLPLEDNVLVYPAHGAGSLCGKSLSDANASQMGVEKLTNWSLQPMTEDDFVQKLNADQPFIPQYFSFDVALNKQGAAPLQENIEKVNLRTPAEEFDANTLVIDTRPENVFKLGHHPNSFNIQKTGKFETWLGSIVSPQESFYVVSDQEDHLKEVMQRTGSIGYESHVEGAALTTGGSIKSDVFDLDSFQKNTSDFTIIDVRNLSESNQSKYFPLAIPMPLPTLRENLKHIPLDKPIVVHCAGGYRSAIGSSIIAASFPERKVYDLGEKIQLFK
jgi:hydroxyacylglutathione hydrolase